MSICKWKNNYRLGQIKIKRVRSFIRLASKQSEQTKNLHMKKIFQSDISGLETTLYVLYRPFQHVIRRIKFQLTKKFFISSSHQNFFSSCFFELFSWINEYWAQNHVFILNITFQFINSIRKLALTNLIPASNRANGNKRRRFKC